jgi:ATP-dependent Clp protease adaptor protein ClpS
MSYEEVNKNSNLGSLRLQEAVSKGKSDDFTPMRFVVGGLINFFHDTQERATKIILQVSETDDVAKSKVAQVNDYARSSEYPLMCKMEIA